MLDGQINETQESIITNNAPRLLEISENFLSRDLLDNAMIGEQLKHIVEAAKDHDTHVTIEFIITVFTKALKESAGKSANGRDLGKAASDTLQAVIKELEIESHFAAELFSPNAGEVGSPNAGRIVEESHFRNLTTPAGH